MIETSDCLLAALCGRRSSGESVDYKAEEQQETANRHRTGWSAVDGDDEDKKRDDADDVRVVALLLDWDSVVLRHGLSDRRESTRVTRMYFGYTLALSSCSTFTSSHQYPLPLPSRGSAWLRKQRPRRQRRGLGLRLPCRRTPRRARQSSSTRRRRSRRLYQRPPGRSPTSPRTRLTTRRASCGLLSSRSFAVRRSQVDSSPSSALRVLFTSSTRGSTSASC